MKKLKLKALELGAMDLLSREQLKNVFGGSGSDWGSGNCDNTAENACERTIERECCYKLNGVVQYGICVSYPPHQGMYCSDLN